MAFLTPLDAPPDAAPLLFYHALATLHAPAYREENEGALRQDWPRVPIPPDLATLEASAELGRRLAELLDQEASVPGVTAGTTRAELRCVAVIKRTDDGQLDPGAGDLDVNVRWGYVGAGGATMPGPGRAEERRYSESELDIIATGAEALGFSLEDALRTFGPTTFDVYLNDHAGWRCVPSRVWDYTLGGYQVIKKWLSYREKEVLGRGLRPDEAREVTNIARRVAAILLLESKLDANYRRCAGKA